jgi:GTP-binding protein Era
MSTEQPKKSYKAGFVTIIGKPNVGKSSLMNALLRQKLSIITPKPQTTRQNILGILSTDDYQLVFIDTPGFLKPRYLLQEKMQKHITNSFKDADIVIFLTDITTFPTDYDRQVSELIRSLQIPCFAVINKIDLANGQMIENAKQTISELGFSKVYFISAKELLGLPGLESALVDMVPEHPPYFPTDDMSTQPVRFFVQEIIREKIFLLLKEELPYSSAVLIDQFKQEREKVVVHATIYVESPSQKKIIIGSSGNMIRKVRELAEEDLTDFLQKKVQLHLWVKVRKDWRKKEHILKELGY